MEDRLVIGGHDVGVEFRALMAAPFYLGDPELRERYVDVPYGGQVDLTEAVGGHPAYKSRDMTFTALVEAQTLEGYHASLSRMRRALHGVEADVECSADPGYTYHGRVTLKDGGWAGGYGKVTISVHASPWKRRESPLLRLVGAGGRRYRVEGGQRPVHPTVECAAPVSYSFNGVTGTVGAGAHVLRDVTIHEGMNEVYIRTTDLTLVRWIDLAEGEAHESTWGDLASTTWDDVQKLGLGDEWGGRTWDGLAESRWSDIADKRWTDIRPPADVSGPTVYLRYDWEDL